jgi:hypothetical protein
MDLTQLRLESLDIYRDGGSISVSFFDAAGVSNTLFFPVNSRATQPDEQKYFLPIVKRYVPVQRTSPITGKTGRDWDKEERASSWLEANQILTALKPQFTDFVSNYRWVFAEMQEAAAREGYLSPSAWAESPSAPRTQ